MITPKQSLGLLSSLLLAGLLCTDADAATLDLTGPAGAAVSLNDRPLGQFPLAGPLDLPPGKYRVTCHVPGHAAFDQTIRLASIDDWQRLTVRPTPYNHRTAWSSNMLLAGLGLHYLDHPVRGYLYNAAEIGGLLVALTGELQRTNLNNDYIVLMNQYHSTINGDEALRLGNLAAATYQDLQNQTDLRNTGLMVAGGAIAVSIIDALISFPSLAAGVGEVPLETALLSSPATALHAGVRLTF